MTAWKELPVAGATERAMVVRVLAFIRVVYAMDGRPPTRREIMDGVGVSAASLERYMVRLIACGAIRPGEATTRRRWIPTHPVEDRGEVWL